MRAGLAAGAILACLGCHGGAPAEPAARAPSRRGLTPISIDSLKTTHGIIDKGPGILMIREPAIRAVAPRSASGEGQMHFVYQGPSDHSTPLSSGQIRRQIGLKLRAQDGCNLVYVMWRIEPVSELVVSVKHNPGKSTHAQCGAHGYRDMVPERGAAIPTLRIGEPHTLSARLVQDELVVRADGRIVWEGSLGKDVLRFDGPVGIRSDNGKFDVIFSAQETTGSLVSILEDG